MKERFFRVPFAQSGNTQVIPDSKSADGSVSFTEGWGEDYEKDMLTDANAKPVERKAMNAVLNDITAAIRALQVDSLPEWIATQDNAGAAFPYGIGVTVRYNGKAYLSLVAGNTKTPGTDATKWQDVSGPVVRSVNNHGPGANGDVKLGTAADADVGTGNGNVMAVGAFGLGGGAKHKDDAYNNIGEIYRVNNTSASAPGGSAYGVISLPCDAGPSTGYFSASNGGSAWIGYSNVPANGVKWNRVYTTAYKPTAQDTGALPLTGGTVTGPTTFEEDVSVGGSIKADMDVWIGGEGIKIYKENNGLWFNVSGRYFGFQNDGVFKAGSVFEDNLRVYSPNNPQPPNTEWATVGSYAYAMWGGVGSVNFNEVVAGSNLYPSGAAGSAGGATLPGSWRCMGIVTTVSDAYRSTLWMRIS